MDKFKSCPSCNEQLDQCLSCASYVVDGERIYYEKLKDFGATQDHELRFINRIQKHRTTAFFHNGKLYIPSRQGRSVPLAIGLQWEAWQEQQAEIDEKDKQIKELKDSVATYKIETYESHGCISYAHHCFMNMDRDQFYKNIEAIICGRLRHSEFSFDRSRIKALRGDNA